MTARRRVLVVDDHPGNVEMLHALLVPEGDDVRSTTDPQGVLTLCADGWHPDVAVIDLMMPSWDGVQVAQWLRQQWPQTRIVIYSAWPGAGALVHVKQAMYADAYLAKPFDVDVLLAAMRGAP